MKGETNKRSTKNCSSSQPVDTPRTQELKLLRQRRLAYYGSPNKAAETNNNQTLTEKPTAPTKFKPPETASNFPPHNESSVVESMKLDSRIHRIGESGRVSPKSKILVNQDIKANRGTAQTFLEGSQYDSITAGVAKPDFATRGGKLFEVRQCENNNSKTDMIATGTTETFKQDCLGRNAPSSAYRPKHNDQKKGPVDSTSMDFPRSQLHCDDITTSGGVRNDLSKEVKTGGVAEEEEMDDLSVISLSTHQPTGYGGASGKTAQTPPRCLIGDHINAKVTDEDFVQARIQEQVIDGPDEKSSKVGFDPTKLQGVLGQDRFLRLLQNLHESEWEGDNVSALSSHVTTAFGILKEGSGMNDQDSAPNKTGVKLPATFWQQEEGEGEEDLGLRTHRPSNDAAARIDTWSSDSSRWQHHAPLHDNVERKNYVQFTQDNVKCTFSADQIYAAAVNMDSTNNGGGFPVRDPLDEDVWNSRRMNADANAQTPRASLDGREVKFLPRKQPFGPIPQTPKEKLNNAQRDSTEEATQEIHDRNPKVTEETNTHQRTDHPERENEDSGDRNDVDDQADDYGRKQMIPTKGTSQPPPPDVPGTYSSLSLEKYFLSMAPISRGDGGSDCFEPIPEPEIYETENRGLSISGQPMRHKGNADTNISRQNLSVGAGRHKHEDSDILKGPSQSGVPDGEVMMGEDKVSKITEEQLRRVLFGDGEGAEYEDEADDDLFTRVTSLVSDCNQEGGGLTERLKKLGIDFNFLKKDHLPCEEQKAIARPSSLGSPKEDQGHTVNALKPARSEGVPESSMGSKQVENSKDTVKVCPECAGINRPYMDWCTECSGILIGVDPVPAKLRRQERKNVQAWIKEDKIREKTNETKQKSQVRFSDEKEKTDRLSVQGGGAMRNSKEEVRESDSFVYDTPSVKPSASMPHQAELSLNLKCSLDSSTVSKSTLESFSGLDSGGQRAKRTTNKKKKSIKRFMGEEYGTFEYSEDKSLKKPTALRAELSLNLRDSLDSNPAASSKTNGDPARNEEVKGMKAESDRVNRTHEVIDERLEHQDTGPDQGPDDAAVIDEHYQVFVQRLVKDSRFRPKQSRDEPVASTSKSQPSASGASRPKSAGKRSGVQSKVRESLEGQSYQRRWPNSSVSWASYNHGELTKPSSLGMRGSSAKSRERPLSAGPDEDHSPERARSQLAQSGENQVRPRPASAGILAESGHHHDDGNSGKENSGDAHVVAPSLVEASDQAPKPRPTSSGKPRASSSGPGGGHSSALGRSVDPSLLQAATRRPAHRELLSVQPLARSAASRPCRPHSSSDEMGKYVALASGYTCRLYNKDQRGKLPKKPPPQTSFPVETVQLMSPRIQEGELSMILCLPEEILLYVLSFLGQADLAGCACTCTQLYRVVMDGSLWRRITIKKKSVSDQCLKEIGKRQPTSLSLIQCHGDRVTANGLRELFRQSAESLMELNFTGCIKGQLTGDNILLHAASRCRNITHLDASWCNINDNGIIAISESCHRLESVCLNGCQAITDDALHAIFIKHGIYLRVLELFGCFNITQRGIASLSNNCKSLVTLNLGQCWKLTDTCISQMSWSLATVENMDLRGCKQMNDASVHSIIRNCPNLQTLALANCPLLTDSAMAEIGTQASQIRSLDLCGCKKVTNVGVKAIATGCPLLEYLDISSTSITHKSVTTLASYCNRQLEILKVNYCKQITITCLVKLARNCRRLKKLYLYGLTGIRSVEEIRDVHPNLWIEM